MASHESPICRVFLFLVFFYRYEQGDSEPVAHVPPAKSTPAALAAACSMVIRR